MNTEAESPVVKPVEQTTIEVLLTEMLSELREIRTVLENPTNTSIREIQGKQGTVR